METLSYLLEEGENFEICEEPYTRAEVFLS